MEISSNKRCFLLILLLLLFLVMIPTSTFYAQQIADQNSEFDYTEHWFGSEATVKSVSEELSKLHEGITVVVTDEDGNPRESGALEQGDIIEILDESGNVFQAFINIDPEDSSSSSLQNTADSTESTSKDTVSPSATSTVSANTEISSGSSSELSSSVSSESSSITSSEESSNPSSDSDSSSRPTVSSDVLFGEGTYYEFSEPVTVEQLREQLAEEGISGSQLTVQTKTGILRQDGAVCTGDILTVINSDGTLQNRVTAVIPGDLMRCGCPNESACKILYNYLTDSGTLSADLRCSADLNKDEKITTSDLLLLKKMILEND